MGDSAKNRAWDWLVAAKQAFDAAPPQLRIHHGALVHAHATGADRMRAVTALASDRRRDVGVVLHLRARRDFVRDHLAQRRLREHVATVSHGIPVRLTRPDAAEVGARDIKYLSPRKLVGDT